MIVRIYRTSGYPPNPLSKERIKEEHRQGYDKILAALGPVNEETKEEWPKLLEALDKELLLKYPRFEDREIRGVDEVRALVEFYGTALAFCIEKDPEKNTDIFTAYIMDEG